LASALQRSCVKKELEGAEAAELMTAKTYFIESDRLVPSAQKNQAHGRLQAGSSSERTLRNAKPPQRRSCELKRIRETVLYLIDQLMIN